MVDIRYTQNIYTNRNYLKDMVEIANFTSSDTILDIGAGEGVITRELCKYSKNIIAYELDDFYFSILSKAFEDNPSVKLSKEDFLKAELPKQDFKIFSNIPFALTSDIINKITDNDSFLTEAYLFVQKESAERFIGNVHNTQIATILYSRYCFSIIADLSREDFKPIPSVDIVLLKISKKDEQESEYNLYRDFVTYVFNKSNKYVEDTFKKLFTEKQFEYIKKYLKENNYSKPSEIPSKYYLETFQYFKTNGSKYRKKIEGFYTKYLELHSRMEKLNRSRVDNTKIL